MLASNGEQFLFRKTSRVYSGSASKPKPGGRAPIKVDQNGKALKAPFKAPKAPFKAPKVPKAPSKAPKALKAPSKAPKAPKSPSKAPKTPSKAPKPSKAPFQSAKSTKICWNGLTKEESNSWSRLAMCPENVWWVFLSIRH